VSTVRARPSRRAPFLVAGAILALSAWFFPYFPSLGSPNEMTRLYLTRAILDDGSFSIDGPVERYGHINDMAGRNDRLYSDKAPGIGFLGVPVYVVAKALAGWEADGVSNASLLRWMRIVLAGVPTAAIALLLFFLLGRMGLGRPWRFFMMVAYGLGTVAFPYGVLLFGHQAATLCLLGAFALVERQTRQPGILPPVAVGLLLGTALLIEYTTALLVVPLGGWCLWVWRRRPRDLVLACAGGVVPIAVLMAYHVVCFGGPFQTGYSHLASRPFAEVHDRGLWGMVTPSGSRLLTILASPQKGLFFFTPWLLLALPALVFSCRQPGQARLRPGWYAVCTGSLLYLVFAMSLQLTAWGWSVGPRHLCPLVPFWVLAVGVLLAAGSRWSRRSKLCLRVLVPYSMAAIVLPTATFGGFPPDFSNPLADFSIRLLLAGCMPPNAASELAGVSPAWGALPFWLGCTALIVWVHWQDTDTKASKLLPLVVACLLTAAVLTITGGTTAQEARALHWVQHDILGCLP